LPPFNSPNALRVGKPCRCDRWLPLDWSSINTTLLLHLSIITLRFCAYQNTEDVKMMSKTKRLGHMTPLPSSPPQIKIDNVACDERRDLHYTKIMNIICDVSRPFKIFCALSHACACSNIWSDGSMFSCVWIRLKRVWYPKNYATSQLTRFGLRLSRVHIKLRIASSDVDFSSTRCKC
jgi:hypothetical protein